MLMADIGLVANAMTALNMDPDLVAEVTTMLMESSDNLEGRIVTEVAPGWFGGSGDAHRIGVNTKMAHQAVEEEFQKLADSLKAYSQIITMWKAEVENIDADTSAEMTTRNATLEQVTAGLDATSDQTSSDTMGDGTYTEPPASGDGA